MLFRSTPKGFNAQAAAKLGLWFSVLPTVLLLFLMYTARVGLRHEPNPQVYHLGFRSLFAGLIGSIIAIYLSAFIAFLPSRPPARSLILQSLVRAFFWIASFKFFEAVSSWLGLKHFNLQALTFSRDMLIFSVLALFYSFLFSVVARQVSSQQPSKAA